MDESFIRENSFYTYTKTMQTYIELFSFRNIKKHLFICLKTYFKSLKVFTFRKQLLGYSQKVTTKRQSCRYIKGISLS